MPTGVPHSALGRFSSTTASFRGAKRGSETRCMFKTHGSPGAVTTVAKAGRALTQGTAGPGPAGRCRRPGAWTWRWRGGRRARPRKLGPWTLPPLAAGLPAGPASCGPASPSQLSRLHSGRDKGGHPVSGIPMSPLVGLRCGAPSGTCASGGPGAPT